jgi:dTDP-4-amino-4,6-dideoxygalactose transaminase
LIQIQPVAPTGRGAVPGGTPFFDGARSFDEDWPRLAPRIEAILTGRQAAGAEAEQLERRIERYTGARHAVACSSGTDALLLLLGAIGIGAGDEVIVPCFTFFASASAVALVGATPVFADIDPLTYTIDPGSAERAVTPRTRAIMPVHLFDQMADMDAIAAIAAGRGLDVVEDSAEAFGMWYGGVHGGLLGRGGVLSFFPTKTLAALGDAGMVVTNDAGVADACRAQLAGRAPTSAVGGGLDDLQAAVLLTRLERVDRDIARRALLAARYDERLAHLAGPVVRPGLAARRSVTNPVHYVYLVEVEDKAGIVRHLQERGIGTEEYYPRPLHRQRCFAGLGYREGDFPVAERACRRTLALPLYPDLTVEAVDRVCDAIADFVAPAGGRSRG